MKALHDYLRNHVSESYFKKIKEYWWPEAQSVGYQINNSDNSNFKTTFHIYTAPKRLERKYTNM